jgi:2-dehydropantoate 2-reductase
VKIAVFGTGGVGGYFGGRLAQSGEDVLFIARGAHYEAIKSDGLRVESIDGNFTISPAAVVDDPAEAGPVDCVILATKAWQVVEAAAHISPLLGSETFIVPLQNGVDSVERLAAMLGPERVLGGTCRVSAFVGSAGVIKHVNTSASLLFGELDNHPSARTQLLREAFAKIPQVRAEIPSDIQAAMWDKFVFVAAVSGVCSVARQPIGVVRNLPETRALLISAAREGAELAWARGVALPEDEPDLVMQRIDRTGSATIPSMQRDVVAGRPSELESMSGAMKALGRKLGIPTPAHDFLYAALLPQEHAARQAWAAPGGP